MGAWGPGLYSNDDAADFVDLVRAVLRLPTKIDDLITLLRTEAKQELFDETTFYLVLADQLEKRGIRHPETTNKAIMILEGGLDIEEMRLADADDNDLKARAKSNLTLLARLKAPREAKIRKTLKKPQPAAVAPGDYVCFPTQSGSSPNPYVPSGREKFVQNGWGLIQIHGIGWEFEYLSLVKLFRLEWPHEHRPNFEDVNDLRPEGSLSYGTLSVTHYKRMQMQVIGNQAPRPDAPPPGPDDRTARFAALNDISIINCLF